MKDGRTTHGVERALPGGGLQKRLLVGLIVLALLSPCGIVLPKLFGAGGAWGEWGVEHVGAVLGYVPEGMKGSAGMWKAPLSDYTFSLAGGSLLGRSLAYTASGVIGLVLVGCLALFLMKMTKRYG